MSHVLTGSLLRILLHYAVSLQRIRSITDANPTQPIEECVIQYVTKKGIRYRVQLLIQAFLRKVSINRLL